MKCYRCTKEMVLVVEQGENTYYECLEDGCLGHKEYGQ